MRVYITSCKTFCTGGALHSFQVKGYILCGLEIDVVVYMKRDMHDRSLLCLQTNV
jgi:hypothetical protein